MQFDTSTPRTTRSIGGKATEGPSAGSSITVNVQVPQPYSAGPHELTEGEANALNQTVAENLSNNLRATVVNGCPAVEADKANGIKASDARPWTDSEVQALVDAYLRDYEIGVRRSGTGEARVTDPVEREARKIARAKANAIVKNAGGKPADYDMVELTSQIFEANRELLMTEGKIIADTLEAARASSDGLSVEGITLPPAQTASAGDGQQQEEEAQSE